MDRPDGRRRGNPHVRHPLPHGRAAASGPSSPSTTCGSTACRPRRCGSCPTSTIPWQTYEFLTRCSQIPRPERIRSDSSSRPDNSGAFPPTPWRRPGRRRSLGHLCRSSTEPLFNDYWTPAGRHRLRATSSARPSASATGTCWSRARCGWSGAGSGGGYFTVLTPPDGAAPTKRIVFRSRFVHLAVGYPGLKFLPDLQEFREKHGDYQHVVNAYEPHEHVYEFLKTRPGTVVVRGGGIVASRVLQRLFDDRERLTPADPDRPHLPHLRHRLARAAPVVAPQGRRRLGLPGLQLPQVGVGRPAQGRDAQARGRRRGRRSTSRWAAPTPPTAGAGRSRCARAARAATTTPCRAPSTGCEPGPDGQLVSYVRSGDGIASEPVVRLHHRLHRPGGRHRRAPGLRRPARARRGGPQPGRPARRRAALRGQGHGQRRRRALRLGHRPPSAATSPASTPSSACRSPPRRSPTTWRGAGSCRRSGRCGRPRSGSSGPATRRS